MAAENKPEDDHGNSNGSHVKIFLPKKLLECLPKCSSLPKERHRWNTNEAQLSVVKFRAGVTECTVAISVLQETSKPQIYVF
ncbi:Hypothetical predicted protein [Podarcis lilfordi]|uniref:Calmodulin binding transcription activator 1 n=1 Tax=Podarcis lilfordi TaxID=74358 RepID=A0AA35KQW9_9SAUR|nr:Hypothetical predicted protein [Podarcis lilfordi]